LDGFLPRTCQGLLVGLAESPRRLSVIHCIV